MNPLHIGDKAPSFKLISSDKKEVNLSDFEGKTVLLLFFPFAFTGTCTKEMCMMRDDITRYQNVKAEVVGISVDSPFTLAKYKEEHQLNFLLLSDFNKAASKAYGCLYEEFSLGLLGVSKRSAFVIDGTGEIKYIEILENASEIPNFAKINAVIESITTN
ncbi:MAG TPA: redoxin domain-containing protein [Saprospiraceae bacterium]|mgnify:CR=1 FL=1|jgi:peroxiredoxin|nr:redoxin domain-containing protein [Saprospiraceae bacterium]HMS28526.1 redoxin domain-containing protein [Saprospiraceae bacterium]